MGDKVSITLSWAQLLKLEKYISALRGITECPQGELKDKDGNLCIEFDDTEVKFTLYE